MQRERVNSESVHAVGYHAGRSTLEVEFRSGLVYQYYQVPMDVYERFVGAASMGQYFSKYVRGRYRSMRVE